MNQEEAIIPPPFPNQQTPPPLSQKENLYEAFVGEKYQKYYQEKFQNLEAPKPKGGLNIAAFLIVPLWLFYRKMYAYGFAYIVLMILYGVFATFIEISDSVDRAISIAIAVTLGFSANGLYKFFVDKKLKQNKLSIEEAQALGGTNPIAAWSLLAIVVVLIGLGIFLDV